MPYGAVMQTPIAMSNKRLRRGGAAQSGAADDREELPVSFRLPGREPIHEQVFYALLHNFLQALAVCGGPVVQPLAGRTEPIGPRN